jgi:dTDP-4-amino-4,6-dideoxygalactose transaminase
MPQKFKIRFNKPFIVGKELYYIAQAVMVESHLSGNGPFTNACHTWLEEKLGCAKALLTHSCTGALEMAAILCDIKPGEEVIMPSFTFVSTANAFVLRGGVPVFVDIRPDTLNIDERLIESAITSSTKAIVPVHYAGVACAMDEILEIAARYNLWVIEDAAQALWSTYKGKFLGNLGNLGCLSFHETKNIISGEGGALLINDEKFVERAEIIWEKGTNRSKFFRVAARYRLFKCYEDGLGDLEEKGFVRRPYVDHEAVCNGHIFYILTNSLEDRTRLIKYLKEDGILAVFHYVPLHSSTAGKKYGRNCGSMSVTDEISSRLLRLPIYYEMKDEDVERVVEAIKNFYLN